MSTQAEMKAAVLERHGAEFRIASNARPEPAAGEVLVRICASGVNPLDTKIHERLRHATH